MDFELGFLDVDESEQFSQQAKALVYKTESEIFLEQFLLEVNCHDNEI